MKWNQSKSSRNCANQPLAELIRDELDEEQCGRLAAHLDDCETCQQRLTVLAGESHWWMDAGRWLDPAVADIDSYDGALDEETFANEEPYYPNAEQELLASGLLEASEKDGLIGTLGRYEVQSVIGAGGTGIVLKAIDIELNRTVAIKALSPALAASGAARRRFAREGQAVAAVAHENVVAVHHVEGAGRLPYLVMQYIDGDSLQDLVVREGPLDVTTALRMTAQLASALSAAHDQGLVHRDVKPANILVGAAGQRVWITDFGLARAVDDASLTRTGFIAGTPHYMSPEQARGEAVRASSDLFGLGSVLYFVLTGRPPFRAERTLAILTRICNEPHRPVREVNPSVPTAVADLVDRLLNKSAADRFADAESVRTHCLQLLAASTAPDSDIREVELDNAPVVAVGTAVESSNGHGGSRYASWTFVILLLAGLGVGFGAYLMRTEPVAVDQPAEPGPIATDRAKVISTPFANRSIPLPDTESAADEDSGGKWGERSTVVPATAETEVDSHLYGAALALTEESPTAPPRDDASPATFDRYSVPPQLPTDPIPPEPAPSSLPQPTDSEGAGLDEESLVWNSSLKELRASFDLLVTQVAQPPGAELIDGGSVSPPASDSFEYELRRMENSLRMLESRLIDMIDVQPNLKTHIHNPHGA